MNKYFWLFLMLSFPLFCKAQLLTINQGKHGQIYLFNPVTEQYQIIVHHITGKLVGVDYINENTCMALFIEKGDTLRKPFTLPTIVHKKDNTFHITHKDSISCIYSVMNTDLKINSDFNTGFLKIYQSDQLVFEYKPLPAEKYVHHKLYNHMLPKFINSTPVDIDIQQQTLLIQQRYFPNEYGNTALGLETAVKEISLKDGITLFYKNKALTPSYSPDKTYILYFKQNSDKAFYRNRKNNIITVDKKSKVAFWI